MAVIENPLTISEISSNVTNVLKFMAERKVKMHQINCKGKSQINIHGHLGLLNSPLIICLRFIRRI